VGLNDGIEREAREVPRGAAHGWAALDHMLEAQERLRQQALRHAKMSNP